jgi:hypothetical protein
MRGNWKRNLILLVVFAAGVVQVTDVYAIWPFRRRANSGYSQGYRMNTRTYGTAAYATTPAMPSATVTAPGVGVNTGPGGVNVAAPGVGVNAGPAGAAVRTPGVGVNAGPARANVGAPGVGVNAGAGANVGAGAPGAGIRVRGQTPEGAPPR